MSGETMTSIAHERHVATGTRSLYCLGCGTWPPDSLDAAWAAAEAALPKGWHIELYGSPANSYAAWGVPDGRTTDYVDDPGATGMAPAVALRKLAGRLAEAVR